MTVQIDCVAVELGRHSENWQRYGIRVKVSSRRRAGLAATNEIDPALANNAQALLQLVGAAGGACAEYLGKRYKDNIDPSEAARLAMQAFAEELRATKALSASTADKIRRLSGQESRLNNNEQELLHRIRWFSERNEPVTPKEAQALDAMILRLHGAAL